MTGNSKIMRHTRCDELVDMAEASPTSHRIVEGKKIAMVKCPHCRKEASVLEFSNTGKAVMG